MNPFSPLPCLWVSAVCGSVTAQTNCTHTLFLPYFVTLLTFPHSSPHWTIETSLSLLGPCIFTYR
ncbi:hypothetical protein E2C01_076562 [Portunus trituberculatus]|uniref:Secreted protein n=1 Tax=Portunus trituberculatus TaxID=210409 RepID=A0A5B7I909_PORTR|nr:hypothetical protein [Portunus trituberculatus]